MKSKSFRKVLALIFSAGEQLNSKHLRKRNECVFYTTNKTDTHNCEYVFFLRDSKFSCLCPSSKKVCVLCVHSLSAMSLADSD